MKHFKLLLVVLVLALALAACGPAQPTSAPATAMPEPTEAPAATATVSGSNVDTGSAFPTGEFIMAGMTNSGLRFISPGRFTAFDGDTILANGTYKVQGNVFTETSNDAGCKTNVSFTYTFDGTHLTFNYVGNPDDDLECSGRRDGFNNVTYTLSPAAKVDTGSDFPTGKFVKAGTTNYGLMFNPDGTFSVFDGDNIAVHGTYKAEGNVLTETSNDAGCKTNVSFNYAFDGTNLTFKYVGNPNADVSCSGRHTDFDKVAYTLSK